MFNEIIFVQLLKNTNTEHCSVVYCPILFLHLTHSNLTVFSSTFLTAI